jgi:hypothetical protein
VNHQLVRRRRRTVPRRRAASALREGACLFAVLLDDCDPLVGPVGLRDRDDVDAVLVCSKHLPHLRRLRPIEAARLGRYLRIAFFAPGEP